MTGHAQTEEQENNNDDNEKMYKEYRRPFKLCSNRDGGTCRGIATLVEAVCS